MRNTGIFAVIAFWVVCVLGYFGLIAGVIYVAWHFISKLW